MGKKLWCKIRLGDWLERFLEIITFGNSHYWAYIIAVKWLGYESCYCEQRRVKMNRWTCKGYEYEYLTSLYEHLESLQLELSVTKSKKKKQTLLLEIENVKKEIKSYE